jgi:hypothetical protein
MDRDEWPEVAEGQIWKWGNSILLTYIDSNPDSDYSGQLRNFWIESGACGEGAMTDSSLVRELETQGIYIGPCGGIWDAMVEIAGDEEHYLDE